MRCACCVAAAVDRKLAATLARYSALAYRSPADVRAALPGARVALIDRDDTQAYLIETGHHSVLAFRGTQILSGFSLADIVSNLWVRRAPWSIGKVHGGYREALLDVADPLRARLVAVRRPLYFTGHSMGGALATLASTWTPAPTATYTFGAPRVGNATFAAALRNVHRIVHGDDPAPLYPLPLGYRHGGVLWHLRHDGSLHKDAGRWRILRLPLGIALALHAIGDHRIELYVRRLMLPSPP